MGQEYSTTPKTKSTIELLWRLQKILLNTLDFNEVVQRVVDDLLTELDYLNLGYRIIVLTLANGQSGILERISLSQTKEAEAAKEASTVPFREIGIPLSANDNLLIQTLREKKPKTTKYWPDIFRPALKDEDALKNQQASGVKTSMLYPVVVGEKAIGVLIFSLIKEENQVSSDEKDLIAGFTDIVGLAVQNSRLFSQVEESSRELKVLNNKLQELDKQKDEFLSVAAHELRAPLTAIKGYLSMILEGDVGQIKPEVNQYIGETMTSTERLIRLVNNMLNISRIEEGRLVYDMGDVNLSKAVQTVFTEHKADAEGKGLQYSLEIAPNISDFVHVDKDRIHEVVGNLISNAIKYTDKGSVTVKLTNDTQSSVRFEVIDTGPGMTQEDQAKLFRKFQRAASSAGKVTGSGLGLYISKLLIQQFNGKIGLSSEQGRGSNFNFTLPLKTN